MRYVLRLDVEREISTRVEHLSSAKILRWLDLPPIEHFGCAILCGLFRGMVSGEKV